MKSIVRAVYYRSFATKIAWSVLLLILWGFFKANLFDDKKWDKVWRWFNRILLVLSILMIFYLTIFRSGEKFGLALMPFSTLQRKASLIPELMMGLSANLFLFVPFGLSFPYLFPEKWKPAGKVLLTVLAGFLLSAGIEAAQYVFHLGMAETDDVIMNTAGTVFGALHLFTAEFFIHLKNKNKK